MAEGRRRDEWARTSHVCALIVNSAPFRTGKPAKPADFNPYAPKPIPLDMTIDDMIAVFVPKPMPAPDQVAGSLAVSMVPSAI